MEKQKTICEKIEISGIGLHTGNLTTLVLMPAPENYGIKFIRTDLPESPVIPADCEHVLNSERGTTIGIGKTSMVYTVEHLMSALFGMGIDNVEIRLNNNEPPILDGSARPFVEYLINAGVEEQNKPKNYFTLVKPVEYIHGSKNNPVEIMAYPSDTLKFEYSVMYDHPLVGEQHFSFEFSQDNFIKEIAAARTFCFDFEIEMLKNRGLAKGGRIDNTVVIGLDRIHSNEKLRYDNEFVRHKLLDLIGDLYLLGMPLKAQIKAKRSGHQHNINFVKKLKNQQ